MIPEQRRRFNQSFTAEKYQRFLSELTQRCGTADFVPQLRDALFFS